MFTIKNVKLYFELNFYVTNLNRNVCIVNNPHVIKIKFNKTK